MKPTAVWRNAYVRTEAEAVKKACHHQRKDYLRLKALYRAELRKLGLAALGPA